MLNIESCNVIFHDAMKVFQKAITQISALVQRLIYLDNSCCLWYFSNTLAFYRHPLKLPLPERQ